MFHPFSSLSLAGFHSFYFLAPITGRRKPRMKENTSLYQTHTHTHSLSLSFPENEETIHFILLPVSIYYTMFPSLCLSHSFYRSILNQSKRRKEIEADSQARKLRALLDEKKEKKKEFCPSRTLMLCASERKWVRENEWEKRSERKGVREKEWEKTSERKRVREKNWEKKGEESFCCWSSAW